MLRERTPVRMDLSHSCWSDIFFLGMDYPEGARVLNVSIDLGVHGRDAAPRPPIEVYFRVIDEPVLRLVSVDLDAAAEFWSAALGLAVTDGGEDAGYRHLADGPGGLHIEVQQVTHPSRVHLDIESDDIEAEVRRLEGLGARRVDAIKTWVVMEAPTGQRPRAGLEIGLDHFGGQPLRKRERIAVAIDRGHAQAASGKMTHMTSRAAREVEHGASRRDGVSPAHDPR